MRPLLPILLTATGCAVAAIQGVDCRSPRVFPNAAVNAVILPYDYVGSNGTLERSQAAQQLGLVLQRDTMLALLRYSSIATVQMIKPPGTVNCDPDRIAGQLLGKAPGAGARLGAGNAAVLLWGVLYEEGDQLYARSFLRMVRNREGGDEVTMQLGDFKFSGEMPLKTVAFPPVRISAADLRAFERQFRESSVVHTAPNESSPKSPIPFDPRYPFGYTVEEARGEWMRIRPIEDGPTGWMRAGARVGASPLQTKMPELTFLVSATGYLQALIANDAGRTADVARNVNLSRQALAGFEKLSALEKAPETRAAVRTLSARLEILYIPGDKAVAWKKAVADLEKASQANSADPRLSNFLTMCRAWLLYNQAGIYGSAAIGQAFRDAATQSADRRALDNLATWYRAILANPRLRQSVAGGGGGNASPPPPPAPPDPRMRHMDEAAVREELAKVEKIRAAVK